MDVLGNGMPGWLSLKIIGLWTLDTTICFGIWYSHFSPFRTLQLGHGGLWDSERLVAEGGRDGEGEGDLMDD